MVEGGPVESEEVLAALERSLGALEAEGCGERRGSGRVVALGQDHALALGADAVDADLEQLPADALPP